MAAPVEVTAAAVVLPLDMTALGALKETFRLLAAIFFDLDIAVPVAARSLMLVWEVSERVSSKTRGLAGGILNSWAKVRQSLSLKHLY